MNEILPVSPGGRRYGRFADNPNNPARKLLALKAPSFTLPRRAVNSSFMGYVRDQGQEGSCTGQMGAEMRDWLYRKFYIFEKNKDVTPDQFRASAAFVYKCNLISDGNLGNDAGSTIHQTIRNLNRYGACTETLLPYSDHDYSTMPSTPQYVDALRFVGGAYHYLPSLGDIKACLASGYTCGFGIDVFESFEGQQLMSTGFMPMPGPNEQLLGGHAQHGMDYDDDIQFPDGSKGGVFVQNSWGSNWGVSAPGRTDRGCYWMPYAYFADHVSDAWMIHPGPAWK